MISTRYNPNEVEDKWYQHWLDKDYFSSKIDHSKEPYSIVIPPPNVTGVLHMGHMLNNTIQDVLIRKARMEGKNACWVPGTDHASIATEAKVVKMLRERGIKKSDLTREEFMEYAWEWKEKYGGIILKQLRKLGASADWNRTRFTMEPKLYDAVIEVFVDLYNKGKVYRGLRMINWDPEAKTVLSNEEVIRKETKSRLFQIRYKVDHGDNEPHELQQLQRDINNLERIIMGLKKRALRNRSLKMELGMYLKDLANYKAKYAAADAKYNWVTIATVRPETIMGDTAIAINPKDERYTHLRGKRAFVPLIGRSIPIIFDRYVKMDFGTGCLKVTPAHDPNDYEIGLAHNLEVIDTLNEDGTLNESAQIHVGVDRFEARKLVVKDLKVAGHLVKSQSYNNEVGYSERTDAVVEPRLSLQWYVDMEKLVKPALDAVMEDVVQFHPEKFKNTYAHWMNNIKNWCISRQLWWGQRIPAYYYGEDIFVAKTTEEALELAKAKTGNADLTVEDLHQDEDVLDTWFSSWLWPISVFDGFESKEEVDYYYPTSVLVTGWDIIFLWVARMIISGYEYREERPFKDVYFTGMVRDKQRRKMSKSLGNSPDALKMIDEYGADAVRFGMLSSAAAGNDLLFDMKLVEQGRNFNNKMWNALRLIKEAWIIVDENPNPQSKILNELAIEFMENRLNQVASGLQASFDTYRLSEVLVSLRSLIWDDFCSWYLEMIKPIYGEPIDKATVNASISLYERMLTLLHPYMPFITEEIWHGLKERKEGEDCIISAWSNGGDYDENILKTIEQVQDIIAKVRDLRNKNQLKQKELLEVCVLKTNNAQALLNNERITAFLLRLGYLKSISLVDTPIEDAIDFVSGTDRFFVKIEKKIDVAAERKRLTAELAKAKKFLIGTEKKLGNERFVNNAPPAVVAKERQKLADGQARVKNLEESLAKLG